MSEHQDDSRKDDLPFVGTGYIVDPIQADKDREERQHKAKQEKYNDQQIRFNRGLFWCTVCLAFFNIIGILLSVKGLNIAKDAARASSKSADATTDAVAESKRQFDVLQSNYTADAEQNQKRFEATLDESRKESAAQQDLSMSGLKASREAISVSRRQLAESSRAKVYVVRATIDLATKPQHFSAEIFNGGTSAAYDLSWGAVFSFNVRGPTSPIRMTYFTNPLAPSGLDTAESDANPAFTDEVLAQVNSGELPLYAWMAVRYRDRAESNRPLEFFCFSFDRKKKITHECEAVNRMVPPAVAN